MTRLFAGTPWDIPPRCAHCGALVSECQCPPHLKSRRPPQEQTARIRLEKRKKGKMVTVVDGLTAAANDLPAVLSRLQTQCGAGGCVSEDSIEVQGEHVQRVSEVLREIGYRLQK
jgi:translation initiation factor 1